MRLQNFNEYLKLFENENEPQVGDYVLMKSQASEKLANLINQTIGRINKIYSNREVVVKYDFPTTILKDFSIDNIRSFERHQIAAFGKTKEELELKIQANKYNL